MVKHKLQYVASSNSAGGKINQGTKATLMATQLRNRRKYANRAKTKQPVVGLLNPTQERATTEPLGTTDHASIKWPKTNQCSYCDQKLELFCIFSNTNWYCIQCLCAGNLPSPISQNNMKKTQPWPIPPREGSAELAVSVTSPIPPMESTETKKNDEEQPQPFERLSIRVRHGQNKQKTKQWFTGSNRYGSLFSNTWKLYGYKCCACACGPIIGLAVQKKTTFLLKITTDSKGPNNEEEQHYCYQCFLLELTNTHCRNVEWTISTHYLPTLESIMEEKIKHELMKTKIQLSNNSSERHKIILATQIINLANLIYCKLFDLGDVPNNYYALRSIMNISLASFGFGESHGALSEGIRFLSSTSKIKKSLSPCIMHIWQETPPGEQRIIEKSRSIFSYPTVHARASVSAVRLYPTKMPRFIWSPDPTANPLFPDIVLCTNTTIKKGTTTTCACVPPKCHGDIMDNTQMPLDWIRQAIYFIHFIWFFTQYYIQQKIKPKERLCPPLKILVIVSDSMKSSHTEQSVLPPPPPLSYKRNEDQIRHTTKDNTKILQAIFDDVQKISSSQVDEKKLEVLLSEAVTSHPQSFLNCKPYGMYHFKKDVLVSAHDPTSHRSATKTDRVIPPLHQFIFAFLDDIISLETEKLMFELLKDMNSNNDKDHEAENWDVNTVRKDVVQLILNFSADLKQNQHPVLKTDDDFAMLAQLKDILKLKTYFTSAHGSQEKKAKIIVGKDNRGDPPPTKCAEIFFSASNQMDQLRVQALQGTARLRSASHVLDQALLPLPEHSIQVPLVANSSGMESEKKSKERPLIQFTTSPRQILDQPIYCATSPKMLMTPTAAVATPTDTAEIKTCKTESTVPFDKKESNGFICLAFLILFLSHIFLARLIFF